MARPLTLLFVAAFPFPGPHGGPVYVAGTARALAARGHRVIVVTYPGGEGAVPRDVDVVRVPKVPGTAVFVGSGPHWSRGPADVGIVAAIRRTCRLRRVDAIHAHHVESTLLARAAGVRVPIVHHHHASLADELPDWFPGVPGAAAFGRAADRLAVRAADRCVAISERGGEALRRLGARVDVVPPGVDVAELAGGDAARARRAWALDGDVVVYTGNTDAYQELPVLLAAMAQVDAALLVVTADPLERLHAMAVAARLPAARRRFVQSSSFRDTKDALAVAAVGAIPRARCAGFPMKLLNLLGAGVPTVVARGAAIDVPGVIAVPDRSPVAMGDALRRLLADPDRAALGAAAREAVRRAWTWDARAPALEAISRG